MRNFYYTNLLLILFFVSGLVLGFSACKSRSLRDQMVNHKPKERKWNSWRKKREMKNKTAYNPYLEKKASEKPSAQINSDNKRAERQAKRAIRKEKRRLRKTKGAYK